jgi:hypothetical protein
MQPRFAETVRLPWRWLRWWIAFNVLVTIGFGLLWSVAHLNAGQRVGFAVVMLFVLVWLWGGALWFVAFHVEVNDEQLTRRIGYKLTRIPRGDISVTRLETSTEPGYRRVVLTLNDGRECSITTRRPDDLARALGF